MRISTKTTRGAKRYLCFGVVATLIVLTTVMGGCSALNPSPETYIRIGDEKLNVDELGEKASENAIAAEGYKGKECEIVSTVTYVKAKDSVSFEEDGGYFSHECEHGYIELDGRIIVEIDEEDSEMASNLKEGDYVKAQGVISGFNNYGSFTNTCVLEVDGSKTSIEKMEN